MIHSILTIPGKYVLDDSSKYFKFNTPKFSMFRCQVFKPHAFFTYSNRAATWWSYACFQRGCPFFPQPTGVWLPGGNERTICIHVEERRTSKGHDATTWKLRFLPRGHCATKVGDADLVLSEFLQGHRRSACTAYIGGVLRMWLVLLLIE